MGVVTDIQFLTKDLVATSHSIQQAHNRFIYLLNPPSSSPLTNSPPSHSNGIATYSQSLIDLHSTFINKCARLFNLVSLLDSKATALETVDAQLERVRIREDQVTAREMVTFAREMKLKIDHTKEEEERLKRKKVVEDHDNKLPQLLKFNIRGTKLSIVTKKLRNNFRGSALEKLVLQSSLQLTQNGEICFDYDVPSFVSVLLYYQHGFKLPFQFPDEVATICREVCNYFDTASFTCTSLLDTPFLTCIEKWLPDCSFNLLFKAARDGFSAQDFHRLCDNKGATLTLVCSEHGYLCGGYTPISWQSTSSRYAHPDMFLFTLSNPHNIPPTKYHLKDPHGNNPGMTCNEFNFVRFGRDLFIHDGKCTSQFGNGAYNDTTEKGDKTFTNADWFSLIDVEVYSVKHK